MPTRTPTTSACPKQRSTGAAGHPIFGHMATHGKPGRKNRWFRLNVPQEVSEFPDFFFHQRDTIVVVVDIFRHLQFWGSLSIFLGCVSKIFREKNSKCWFPSYSDWSNQGIDHYPQPVPPPPSLESPPKPTVLRERPAGVEIFPDPPLGLPVWTISANVFVEGKTIKILSQTIRETITVWWFQPPWKILVKMDHFPK